MLLAEAERTAETTRGDGDREASRIWAGAFGQDAEFFHFYRSMQAYREALRGDDTTMVLSPDSDFFRFFGTFGPDGLPDRKLTWPMGGDLAAAAALALAIEGALHALSPRR